MGSYAGANFYSENNSKVFNIPTITVSSSSNLDSDLVVPKDNIIEITVNPVTSMVQMSSVTTTIKEINSNRLEGYNKLPEEIKNKTPFIAIPEIIGPNNNLLNSSQVMIQCVFNNIFYGNSGLRLSRPGFYKHLAGFNTTLMTYSNFNGNLNYVRLSTLFLTKIAKNLNTTIEDLDDNILFYVRNFCRTLTITNNINGKYLAVGPDQHSQALNECGIIKCFTESTNLNEAQFNPYSGVIVEYINKYKIYLTLPKTNEVDSQEINRNYLIELSVPWVTYLANCMYEGQFNNKTSDYSLSSNYAFGGSVPSEEQIKNKLVVPKLAMDPNEKARRQTKKTEKKP